MLIHIASRTTQMRPFRGLHIAAHLPSLVFRLVPCPALACPHLSGLTRLLDPNEGSEVQQTWSSPASRSPTATTPFLAPT
ncbi:hypothetical protein CGGC5_v003313 [Colletotrichum fructicola Nara gc5]|uniref:Uncharacterized protein n=1 Tax=Colletotrichum fructicola (strain Nara gc5) TaxID=1213859 RepID=A0A7J6JHS1_COLFN|nr:hypothetical protein CGGC5_v003313 [Colletotrichum fructicola Nara gc5]